MLFEKKPEETRKNALNIDDDFWIDSRFIDCDQNKKKQDSKLNSTRRLNNKGKETQNEFKLSS